MLPILLKDDHGEQARSGKAARQDVERRRCLRYRLAGPAGELLANDLDHLPLPRHHFQRLGYVLAELGQLGRTTTRAGRRTRHDDALARQIRRERFARGLLPREAANGWRRIGEGYLLLGRDIVFAGGGFEFFEFKLQLSEQPRLAFVAWPKNIPLKLLDG